MPNARTPARHGPLPTDVHALFGAPLPNRIAAAAFALVPGVGPVRWRALVTRYDGDAARAAAAYGTPPAIWKQALDDATRHLGADTDTGRLLVAGDAGYPRALLDLPDAPPLLWVRGQLAALAAAPAVALVGTRHNSSAGAHAARRLVTSLRDTGAGVISGMARGIDGVVHDAALAAGLVTVAVLGTGVDVPYPAQHRRLYARIVEAGAVVSEQPPGTTAAPGAFPRRNRIIAALADCTVVVEAGERSGALITADVALDLGRTVAAVPGPIDSEVSAGANALLRDGAHVLATVDDLLPLLRTTAVRTAPPLAPRTPERSSSPTPTRSSAIRPPSARSTADLHGDERTLWDALVEPALDADAAAERAGLSARRCAAALAHLELRGAVVTEISGAIQRL